MTIFIADKQNAKLNTLMTASSDKCFCDRIYVVLLASECWLSAMIAQALSLHKSTVNQNTNDYVNTRKLKPENGRSASRAHLVSRLSQHLFHCSHTRIV